MGYALHFLNQGPGACTLKRPGIRQARLAVFIHSRFHKAGTISHKLRLFQA
jgi:hypothetical protein